MRAVRCCDGGMDVAVRYHRLMLRAGVKPDTYCETEGCTRLRRSARWCPPCAAEREEA